ncbi:MAG TPA: hypothetical protein VNA27_06960 [Rubrobacteraceae bacterium]|nr:hypothetical protein [Rubrobacteraceae bacterium]
MSHLTHPITVYLIVAGNKFGLGGRGADGTVPGTILGIVGDDGPEDRALMGTGSADAKTLIAVTNVLLLGEGLSELPGEQRVALGKREGELRGQYLTQVVAMLRVFEVLDQVPRSEPRGTELLEPEREESLPLAGSRDRLAEHLGCVAQEPGDTRGLEDAPDELRPTLE